VKQIIGIILIIVGVIVLLFFDNYPGGIIPYPILWYLLSIVIIGIGVLLIRKSLKQKNEEITNQIENELNRLKKYGDKILVDLDKCEILTNNYVEEIESDSSYTVQRWDALYDSSRNIKKVNVYQTRLLFESNRLGKKEKFYSPTINKDEVTIRFLLALHKNTFIYIDRMYKDKYYFDINFLLEEK